jgi:hypothetical protein
MDNTYYYKARLTFNDGMTEVITEARAADLFAAIGEFCKHSLGEDGDPVSIRIERVMETETGNYILSSFETEEG